VRDGVGAANRQGRGTRWVDFAEIFDAGTEGGYTGDAESGGPYTAIERNADTAGPGGVAARAGYATKATVLVDDLGAADCAELFDTLLLGH
jgi:hypothetical protein